MKKSLIIQIVLTVLTPGLVDSECDTANNKVRLCEENSISFKDTGFTSSKCVPLDTGPPYLCYCNITANGENDIQLRASKVGQGEGCRLHSVVIILYQPSTTYKQKFYCDSGSLVNSFTLKAKGQGIMLTFDKRTMESSTCMKFEKNGGASGAVKIQCFDGSVSKTSLPISRTRGSRTLPKQETTTKTQKTITGSTNVQIQEKTTGRRSSTESMLGGQDQSADSETNVAITAGAVGGGVGLLVIIVIIILITRKKKSKMSKHNWDGQAEMTGNLYHADSFTSPPDVMETTEAPSSVNRNTTAVTCRTLSDENLQGGLAQLANVTINAGAIQRPCEAPTVVTNVKRPEDGPMYAQVDKNKKGLAADKGKSDGETLNDKSTRPYSSRSQPNNGPVYTQVDKNKKTSGRTEHDTIEQKQMLGLCYTVNPDRIVGMQDSQVDEYDQLHTVLANNGKRDVMDKTTGDQLTADNSPASFTESTAVEDYDELYREVDETRRELGQEEVIRDLLVADETCLL